MSKPAGGDSGDVRIGNSAYAVQQAMTAARPSDRKKCKR